MYMKRDGETEALLNEVISFANLQRDKQLRSDAFSIFRTMYLDQGALDRLSNLYRIRYSDEFGRISREERSLYMRLQAYFAENDGTNGYARKYYDSAESLLSGSGYQRSAFYYRYGQFLLRDKDTPTAIQKLRSAFYWARSEDYPPFMIDASMRLDSIYMLQRKSDSAYYYQSQHRTLSDRWAAITSKEKIQMLTLDAEIRKDRLDAEKALILEHHHHNLQYITILLCFLLGLILLVVFNAIRLSKTWLRVISFLTFLFLFECINMFIHHKLETHTSAIAHRPLLILLIKVCVAGVIVFFHHSSEEKALHYFSSHHLFDPARFRFRKKKPVAADPVPNGQPPQPPPCAPS